MMLFLLIMVNPTLLATKRITTQHAFTKHYMLEQCMLTHNLKHLYNGIFINMEPLCICNLMSINFKP